MCIALYKPANVIMTKKVLKACFENNPHGAGMAYPSNNKSKVIIDKGFFGFRDFWKKFQKVQYNRPMLIHFRVATSGVIDKKNCHPWRIDSCHALIHNGVIANKIGLDSEEYSDTGLFVNHLLKPAFLKNTNFWKTDAFKWTFEKAVGDKNKFAIIDNNGKVVIFNEAEGEWDREVWFSNDTYKNARKSITKPEDRWVEQRGGHTVIAKRGKHGTTYHYVEKPFSINKIINFTKNQLSNTANNMAASYGKEVEDKLINRITSEIETIKNSETDDQNEKEVDITAMI